MFYKADLHIHSFGEGMGSYDVTDTTNTPQAIVDTAIAKGIKIISITDHNEILDLQRGSPNPRFVGSESTVHCPQKSLQVMKIIARADVPWSAVWRGSRCSMDTNRCHRASGCALEASGMAIAVSDELQEKGTQGLHSRVCQVGVLSANHRASECALERCQEGFAMLDGHKSMPSRERMYPAGP